MNLRNYDNIMAAKQLCVLEGRCISTGEHTNFADGHLTVKTMSATPNIYRIYHAWGNADYGIHNPFSLNNNDITRGLICGSGDTPVSYDDYRLDATFTADDISHVSWSVSDTVYDKATNTFTRTAKRIFAAKKDLVIREIGFSSNVPGNASQTGTSASNVACLTYRKILDEPVSVKANSNFELTFTTVVSACANKPAEYDAGVTTE